jgi:hypothetical protein
MATFLSLIILCHSGKPARCFRCIADTVSPVARNVGVRCAQERQVWLAVMRRRCVDGLKNGYSGTGYRKAGPSMPNKHGTPRRHHIPKMKCRMKNRTEYDAGLRCRGSLTLWITPEVPHGRQAARRTHRGGQPVYSALESI